MARKATSVRIAKKAKPRKTARARSGNKTAATDASVNGFVAAIPHPTRRADAFVLLDMMARVTGEQPRLWGPSIIGFGSYHYRYESGREGDAPLAAFSPRKAAMVVYVMTGFHGADALLARLGKHRTGKSCLYLGALGEIDRDVLKELITRSVRTIREKYAAA